MIRRELIKFAGGAATGIMFTPLPWRMLGDAAIWTQNWSWMPRTPRGEVAESEAHCTLCPAGCAVKLKTCAGTPTGVWPRGEAMCPAGLAGHTLAYHPLRLRQCLHKGQPGRLEQAVEAARAASSGATAVLDLLPGRTASLLHRAHLAGLKDAKYIPAPMAEGGTAEAMSALLAAPAELCVELSRAKTVLSVSTPLLDGWAAPRRAGQDRGFQLWQADAFPSRSTELADESLIIRPESETALLLGLGRMLLKKEEVLRRARTLSGFAEFVKATEGCTAGETAAHTGLSEERLAALAAALLGHGPAVVVADGDPLGGPLPETARMAAAALNMMLAGNVFTRRQEPPVPATWRGVEPTALASVPAGSISLLIIDEPAPGLALPWAAVAPKLARDAMVVALTWNRSNYARRAEWLVPVPVYLEHAMDAPPAHDTGSARMAASPALIKPPAGAIAAADFVARMAGAEPDSAARLEERIKLAGTEEIAAAAAPGAVRLLPAGADAGELAAAARTVASGPHIAAHGWRLASVSPLLGKIWQEWDLRSAPGEFSAHPESLRAMGLHAGPLARIESAEGQMTVKVEPAGDVPQGVVSLCAGPAYSQICDAAPDGAWRLVEPKVVRS